MEYDLIQKHNIKIDKPKLIYDLIKNATILITIKLINRRFNN